ncbi:MAG: hypothetical protein A3K41_04235 [Chloroflexi bacterium RIFOXYD12_FULL_57_15]|nr:MAG: hypothetical protein A3K41_04235 [Chloroflexi bacterium RIFOXYD12_FULL_57_15]
MKARNSIKSGGGVRSLLTSGKIGPFTGCFAKILQSAVITFGVCYKYSAWFIKAKKAVTVPLQIM